jgi:uncharacterized OB-fold protein
MVKNGDNEPFQDQKQCLVEEGLIEIPSSPSDEPQLLAGRCKNCEEVTFPRQTGCPNCCMDDIEPVKIGPEVTLYSFTNVNHPVPEGYKGPIPYGVGLVDFPEGPRIVAHLTEHDPEKLKVGMDMIMVIDKMFEDEEGHEVIGFKFKPV